MIYGYAKKTVDSEYGLLQMREVSFEMSPKQLRQVAAFFESAAADLESGSFKSDHRHLQSCATGWNDPSDIVVLRPGGDAE